MKKFLALLMVMVLALCVVSCTPAVDPDAKSEGTMTHAEYVAAELDTEVTIEAFVQGKQSWWEDDGVGKGTFYLQDGTGGYFIYELNCTEEQYNSLTVGTKIKVTGFKMEWSGEVEIDGNGATFEILEDKYVADPTDLTEVYANETELIKYQNMLASVKGLTVKSEALYKWDGSGSEGDDLYITLTLGEDDFTFVVESYLCDKDTDVYKAVKALAAGDKIDVEGFVYWYNGPQLHLTKVTKK